MIKNLNLEEDYEQYLVDIAEEKFVKIFFHAPRNIDKTLKTIDVIRRSLQEDKIVHLFCSKDSEKRLRKDYPDIVDRIKILDY